MNRSNSARNVAAAVAALAATLLAGCSWTGSFFSSDKVQYETAQDAASARSSTRFIAAAAR